jgi:GT2 family glycosyltransferase
VVQGANDIDVCVVAYNSRGITLEALKQLAAGAPGLRVGLFVYDNGSDGTGEAVRGEYPEAVVLSSGTNVGFAAGMNQLLRRTTAPHVLVLNPDAWPLPGALRALWETAQKCDQAKLAAAVPLLLRRDTVEREHSTWPFPSVPLSLAYALNLVGFLPDRLARRLMLDPAWHHDQARWVSWAVGAAWLVPRVALDAVGELDETTLLYGEDVDWCWRARAVGRRVRFEPGARFLHVGGASAEPAFGSAWVATAKAGASVWAVRRHRGRRSSELYRRLEHRTACRLATNADDPASAAAWGLIADAFGSPRTARELLDASMRGPCAF